METPAPGSWVPEVTLGLLALAFGWLEAVVVGGRAAPLPVALVVLGTGSAVVCARRRPGLALGLVWLVGLYQVFYSAPVLLLQAGVCVVAFATARWGSAVVVWLSALSMPAAAGILLIVGTGPLDSPALDYRVLTELFRLAGLLSDTAQIGFAVMGMSVLGVPWLVGLSVRFSRRAQESRQSQRQAEEEAARAQVESAQAREIARLRAEQAELARDVHDVVGHSLAVILAQAESGQFLSDGDPARLKQTLATIAASSRSSLREVRQVLTATGPSPVGELDGLVDRLRDGGREIISTEVGVPRTLTAEQTTVAFRVLQEMLTNAVRHGRRDAPVHVDRRWDGDLRIEVRNLVSVETTLGGGAGSGLDGIRRRLESVGGRFVTDHRDEPTGPWFVAVAWIPVVAGPSGREP